MLSDLYLHPLTSAVWSGLRIRMEMVRIQPSKEKKNTDLVLDVHRSDQNRIRIRPLKNPRSRSVSSKKTGSRSVASEKPDPPLNCGGKSHQVLPFLFMFLSGIVYCLLSEHNICEPAVEKSHERKKQLFLMVFSYPKD